MLKMEDINKARTDNYLLEEHKYLTEATDQ
jgi:hypothetical protein